MNYSSSEFYIINAIQTLALNKCLLDSKNIVKVDKAIKLLIACLPVELANSIKEGLK